MTNDLISAVNGFSEKLRAAGTFDDNYIASALGAWLLLAQAAGGNSAALTLSQRGDIEKWLGMDVEKAHDLADRLLGTIPDRVALASAVYAAASVESDTHLQNWLKNLSPATTYESPIPSKAALDSWTKKESLEILDEFPINENMLADTVFILANILATKIAWRKPFEAVDSELGFWQVEELLRSYDLHVRFAKDELGNVYGYCNNQDETGIKVYTVIALDASVPEQQVMTFAEKIAADQVKAVTNLEELMPASDVHTLVIKQGYSDTYQVTLPAWQADTSQDLMQLGVPLAETADTIIPGQQVAGLQIAKAEYNKLGFQAAALSAMFLARGAMPRERTVHEIDLKFSRPFAAVAVYQPFKQADIQRYENWDKLPLFTAWITTAMEPTDKKFD
jgi:hypothetical protein